MAECLNKSTHDNGSVHCSYDTDEEDDYDEFCDRFTFSVSMNEITREFFRSFDDFIVRLYTAHARLLRLQWLLCTEFRRANVRYLPCIFAAGPGGETHH